MAKEGLNILKYLSDCDSRPDVLESVHRVIIHGFEDRVDAQAESSGLEDVTCSSSFRGKNCWS